MLQRRTFAATVSMFLIAAMIGIPATPSAAYSSSLRQTRDQIRATRQHLRDAMQTDAEIVQRLNQITTVLYRAEDDLSAARAHLNAVDVQISTTRRHVATLAAEMTGREQVIRDRAAALYMMGPVGILDASQGGGSIGDYIARAGALDYIGTFDRSVLQDLDSLRHQQIQATRELGIERQYANVAAKQVAARVSVVAEAAAAQAEAHRLQQRRVSSYTQELKDEMAQQRLIEEIIASRGSSFRGTIESNPSQYGFQWPTISHHINSPFGPRNGGYHTGIDIQCSMGQPIAASRGGKVIAAEWGGGYGNMTIVDHGDGHATLYAHQSRQYVSQGDSVIRGQVIGACGSTGNSTGPHLHFEMHIHGYTGGPTSWCRECVNPRPYLP